MPVKRVQLRSGWLARFLTISDERDISLALKQCILRCGHQCDNLPSDTDILSVLPLQGYELIFCDTQLKSSSGYALVKTIKTKYPNIEAIMVANKVSSQMAEEVLSAGASDFISIPIDCHRVKISLANALDRRQVGKGRDGGFLCENPSIARTETENEREMELQQLSEALELAKNHIINSEKMAAIGQLASGVAHEINNPVGFVASNLNTLQYYQKALMAIMTQYGKLLEEISSEVIPPKTQSLVDDRLARIKHLQTVFDIDYLRRDMRALISESIVGISRVNKIVRDLNTFAHPGQESPEFIDIHNQLDSTLNLVWNQLKYNIKVRKDYGDLPLVKCWASQINQVFLNIIVNGIQAVTTKGILSIKTRVCNSKEVEICISDTGKGISAEYLSNIFDPFFTTKSVGQGTGLGLHVSNNIIKKHKGSITVKSRVDHGSEFKIKLPINL